MFTNESKAVLLALVESLQAELKSEPTTALTTQALHQSERLHLSIAQFHAEGLRFAAFTLQKLTTQVDNGLKASTLEAAAKLREALELAGFGHGH